MIEIIRHETLEECVAKFYNCEESEIYKFKVTFENTNGSSVWPVRRMIRVRKKRGTWGWVENKGAIHIWVSEKAPMHRIIRLLAHELGHKEKPYYKNRIQEERKAEKYADAAVASYNIACDIMEGAK
jgi:uncharacterized protein YjaZ